MLAKALSNTLIQKRAAASSISYIGDSIVGLISSTSSIQIDSALGLSAVYNAVDSISNDIAVLPKSVYKSTSSGKEKQSDHKVTYLISKRPNQNQTAFTFFKALMTTALLRGNAVAIINRHQLSGEILSLIFVHPNDLYDIKMYENEMFYVTKFGTFSADQIIHIKGFSTNGYTGISVLNYAAKNLNAAIKAENFAETNFDSKGFGLGIIKTAKALNANAKKSISSAMEARLSKGGAYNVGVLDEGMEWEPITVSAKEAELIDWKKVTTQDVARWFNTSTYKLKLTEDHNYSTIEQASIDHLQDCLMPWIVQLEQELSVKLFNYNEKQDHYIKFNTNSVLRADIKSRAEYYTKMRFGGILSGDEIREKEDYNATGLPHMAVPLQPVQVQQQSQIQAENEEK